MFASPPQRLNRVAKTLLVTLTASLMAGAALPAWAQGDRETAVQGGVPTLAAAGIERGNEFSLAHKVKLGVPSVFVGDGNMQAPKLSLEFGYGRSLPPAVGSVSPVNLPEEFWGRANQSVIKANVTLGF